MYCGSLTEYLFAVDVECQLCRGLRLERGAVQTELVPDDGHRRRCGRVALDVRTTSGQC